MASGNQTLIIVIVIVVIIIIIWLLTKNSSPAPVKVEGFDQTAAANARAVDLALFYEGGTIQGIPQDFFVDQMQCSPECCGLSWPVPFDGLNEQQIRAVMIKNSEAMDAPGPFVRNNFTCGSVPGAVVSGCPCMTPQAANFLASRGGNGSIRNAVDASFYLKGPEVVEIENTPTVVIGDGLDYLDVEGVTDMNLDNLPYVDPNTVYQEEVYGF